MGTDEILLISKNKQTLPNDIINVIKDLNYRNEIYKKISINSCQSLHALIKLLFQEELKYRLDDNVEEFFENIYRCAFLLYNVGDLNDVKLMWNAKQSDFDLSCGFDIQFIIGAGYEKTLDFLSHELNNTEIIEYIKLCKKGGDFDYMNEWYDSKMKYFGFKD